MVLVSWRRNLRLGDLYSKRGMGRAWLWPRQLGVSLLLPISSYGVLIFTDGQPAPFLLSSPSPPLLSSPLLSSAQSYRAQSDKAQSYKALSHKALSYKAHYYKALSYRALSYKALSYRALSYIAQSHKAPSYKALSYPQTLPHPLHKTFSRV